ncbi:hypothetical protein VTN77DRAFT_7450 [Rasamsonia byssochlamydoides]|uniref:uncharacterized protein n=1 Tax=Rasamsonia byssochlamydoides TaxID=89139 RepID=UPI003742186D
MQMEWYLRSQPIICIYNPARLLPSSEGQTCDDVWWRCKADTPSLLPHRWNREWSQSHRTTLPHLQMSSLSEISNMTLTPLMRITNGAPLGKTTSSCLPVGSQKEQSDVGVETRRLGICQTKFGCGLTAD